MRGKFLPSGMLSVLAFCLCRWRCGRQWIAPAFGFCFLCADAGLKVQQVQLFVAELLAFRPVFVDQFQTQAFFQRLDFQTAPLQFLRQKDDLFGFGAGRERRSRTHRRLCCQDSRSRVRLKRICGNLLPYDAMPRA
jgi:hypothetical protein